MKAPDNMHVEEVTGMTMQVFHHHNYMERSTITLECTGNSETDIMDINFKQWAWGKHDTVPDGDTVPDSLFNIELGKHMVLTDRDAASILYQMHDKIERAVFEKQTGTGPGKVR
tara:strand:+ start:891 stop:1232 length:342 start_codon:yes stop_codon:yes gene_type:complete